MAQTVAEEERHLGAYKAFLKTDQPLSAVLTPEHGFSYLNGFILRMDREPETKSKYLKNVNAFYEWCRQRGHATLNPFQGLTVVVTKGRKSKQKSRRAWTDSELEKLFDGLLQDAESGHDKRARSNARRLIPMSIIAAYTGLRIDEIAELRVKDATGAGLVEREGKTDAAVRTVPIHPKLQPLVDSVAVTPLSCEIPSQKSGTTC